MEYKCKLEKLDKLTCKDSADISLCTKCQSFDCSNPIENVTISMFGVNTGIRVYVTRTSVFGVKQCEGFSSRGKSEQEEDDDED